jgi:hypothetical protein
MYQPKLSESIHISIFEERSLNFENINGIRPLKTYCIFLRFLQMGSIITLLPEESLGLKSYCSAEIIEALILPTQHLKFRFLPHIKQSLSTLQEITGNSVQGEKTISNSSNNRKKLVNIVCKI